MFLFDLFLTSIRVLIKCFQAEALLVERRAKNIHLISFVACIYIQNTTFFCMMFLLFK